MCLFTYIDLVGIWRQLLSQRLRKINDSNHTELRNRYRSLKDEFEALVSKHLAQFLTNVSNTIVRPKHDSFVALSHCKLPHFRLVQKNGLEAQFKLQSMTQGGLR